MSVVDLSGYRSGLTKINDKRNIIFAETTTPGDDPAGFLFPGETLTETIEDVQRDVMISYMYSSTLNKYYFQKNILDFDTGSPMVWKTESAQLNSEVDGWITYYYDPTLKYTLRIVPGFYREENIPEMSLYHPPQTFSTGNFNIFFHNGTNSSYYVRRFATCPFGFFGTLQEWGTIGAYYFDVQKVSNDGVASDPVFMNVYPWLAEHLDGRWKPYYLYNGYKIHYKPHQYSDLDEYGIPYDHLYSAPYSGTSRSEDYLIVYGAIGSAGNFQGSEVYESSVYGEVLHDYAQIPTLAYCHFADIGDDTKVHYIEFDMDEAAYTSSAPLIIGSLDNHIITRTSNSSGEKIIRVYELTDTGAVEVIKYTMNDNFVRATLKYYDNKICLVLGKILSGTYRVCVVDDTNTAIFEEDCINHMVYEDGEGLIFIMRDLVGGSYVTRQKHFGNTTVTDDFTSKYSNDIILDNAGIVETENYLYGGASGHIRCVRKRDLYHWDIDAAGDYFITLPKSDSPLFWYKSSVPTIYLYDFHFDPPPFTVTTTNPGDEANVEDKNTAIEITFSDYVEEDTIEDSANSIYVTYIDGEDTHIPWTLTDVTSKTVTIQPDDPLLPNSGVNVHCGSDLISVQETVLDPEYDFQFYLAATFYAIANYPPHGAINVALNTIVSITFDAKPDAATCITPKIKMESAALGMIIPHTLVGVFGETAIMQPWFLPSNDVITVTATDGVYSDGEDSISLTNAPYAFAFSTFDMTLPTPPTTRVSGGAGKQGRYYGVMKHRSVQRGSYE